MAYEDVKRYSFTITCETDDPQGAKEVLAMMLESFSRTRGAVTVEEVKPSEGEQMQLCRHV